MGGEWKTSTLGETCYITDGAHSKVERQVEGVLYLTSKNIGEGKLNLDKVDYISEDDFHRLFTDTKKSQRKLRDGDVLTGIIGTFGNAYRYKRDDYFGISSSVAILRPDPNKLNPDYLYYAVTSKIFKSNVEAYKGGSVQGYTNIATLKALPIPLPDLLSQKRIAKILGSLDEKIELNRQINTTLESMAQALFKSWFVDFDPVIDNALAAGNPIPDALQARAEKRKALHEQPSGTDGASPLQPFPADIRALFPDGFVFNEEMGWVPEGWKVSLFGEVIKPSKGRNITKKDVGDGDIPVVAGGLSPAYYHNEANVFGPVVTVSASGANAGFVSLYLEDIWASDCSYISSEHTNQVFSTYLFLKERQDEITFMQQGAAQPHVYPKDLMRLRLVVPPEELRMLLERYVKDYFLRIQVATNEILTLSKLRDALLPKLLSGQIKVASCEALVAEVL